MQSPVIVVICNHLRLVKDHGHSARKASLNALTIKRGVRKPLFYLSPDATSDFKGFKFRRHVLENNEIYIFQISSVGLAGEELETQPPEPRLHNMTDVVIKDVHSWLHEHVIHISLLWIIDDVLQLHSILNFPARLCLITSPQHDVVPTYVAATRRLFIIIHKLTRAVNT